jgi:predicted transcriptional regulator
MRVLEEKGYVEHGQDGPRYLYRPTLARDKARSAALRHVVRTFFNGSAAQAAAALLQMTDARMKPEDLERLAREVERARKEGR